MGREFELKYEAGQAQLDILLQRYPHLQPIEMETSYYDNARGDMKARHWTLRRRMENGVSVCSLKTPAGLLARGEWEVECDDIEKAIPLILATGAPAELGSLTADGLHQTCGARFTRMAGLIELDGAAVELALDAGVFLGGGKEQPFTEVEVELKSGSETVAVAFAEALARELGMKPEHRSKIARALALAAD